MIPVHIFLHIFRIIAAITAPCSFRELIAGKVRSLPTLNYGYWKILHLGYFLSQSKKYKMSATVNTLAFCTNANYSVIKYKNIAIILNYHNILG
jgi:hypothetical protein